MKLSKSLKKTFFCINTAFQDSVPQNGVYKNKSNTGYLYP